MSPRHPLSGQSRDRALPFWGGIILLAILVITVRWTRSAPGGGGGPVSTTGGVQVAPAPYVPSGLSSGLSSALPSAVPSPVPAVNAPAAPFPAPSTAVGALPVVGPSQSIVLRVGPGQQTAVVPNIPAIGTQLSAGQGALVPQVGAPGVTIITQTKTPVMTPFQLFVTATSPRVIPAFWILTVQMPAVNAIQLAPDGRVWAATDRGLAEIRTDQVTFLSREAGTFPAPNATCLAHDGRALWIGTFEGLLRTEDGRIFQRFSKIDGLAHEMIWSLEWDGAVLWVGTQNGFSFFAPNGRFEIVDKKISNGGLADLWVGAIRKFGRWVLCGNDDGLSVWDTTSFAANPAAWVTLDMFATNLVHNWILALAVFQDHLWAGTPLGLCRLNTPMETVFGGATGSWEILNRARGLPGDRVNALAGLGDSLWIGTNEGLCRRLNGSLRSIGTGDGLLASDVRALAGGLETLWVGTSAGIQALSPALLER